MWFWSMEIYGARDWPVTSTSSVRWGLAPYSAADRLSRFITKDKVYPSDGPSCRANPPNPSELLGSLNAERMLSELRSQFDYVVIDSAPLLAVTDGAILAAKSDGALVVVRSGKTKRDQLSHAIGMLNDVGATLLGAVLTMTPTRGTSAYNYGYYYSGNYRDDQPEAGGAGGGSVRDRAATDCAESEAGVNIKTGEMINEP